MEVRDATSALYRVEPEAARADDDVPPGYKRTEVGVIPEDWSLCELRRLTKQPATYGVVKAGLFLADGIPMLRGGDIKDGHASAQDLPLISQAKSDEYQRTLLRVGDVVIALVGYPGEAAVIGRSLEGANISRAVGLIRPRDTLAANFLACYLNAPQGRAEFLKPSAGSAQLVVNLRDLNELLVPLPPTKVEQEAIAEVLSDADALIESLQQLIAKQRALKQGTMQALLTGRQRLPGFTGEWRTNRIGEFTDCTTGGTPSTRIPEYWGGNHRWMNSGELNKKVVSEVEGRITDAGLRNSSTKEVPANCVLIGLAGQGKTRGTAAINTVALCTNQSIAAIFPSYAHVSKFLYYVLDTRYEELRELSSGEGGRGGLNLTLIRNLEVPIPSVEEQTAIATVLSDMDAEIEALEARLAKTRALKAGMMQQLLTGRIRLSLDRAA